MMKTLGLLCTVLCAAVVVQTAAVRIGAFNVKSFGLSKMSKPEVVEILIDIVLRYDILLIQEIRDASQTAIYDLLGQLNEDERARTAGIRYAVVLGSRAGRTSYKEQYAYLYKVSAGISVHDSFEFDDGDEEAGDDTFEREPFVVRLNLENNVVSDLALIGVHVKPSDAVAEIKELLPVHEYTQQRWAMEDILILGDLNADCSYVSKSEWNEIELRMEERFMWLIGDDADTTVSGNTDCAYDRFVASGYHVTRNIVPGSIRAFRFDEEYGLDYYEARDVSDHYPIEMELY